MKKLIRNSTAEFLIFTAQASDNSIEVRVKDETVWLTQKLIAELFGKGQSTITEHLCNIFAETELDEDSVCREFRHTGSDGKSYQTKFYNLNAIISVGYRLNSKRAAQFRKWATQVLSEFAIKGFVLDNKRLENGAFLNEYYTLRDCWTKFEKSGLANACSIRKSPTFTRPVWTITKTPMRPKVSLPRFKISLTLACMAIRQLS